jgi:hypothetical protein
MLEHVVDPFQSCCYYEMVVDCRVVLEPYSPYWSCYYHEMVVDSMGVLALLELVLP